MAVSLTGYDGEAMRKKLRELQDEKHTLAKLITDTESRLKTTHDTLWKKGLEFVLEEVNQNYTIALGAEQRLIAEFAQAVKKGLPKCALEYPSGIGIELPTDTDATKIQITTDASQV